MKLKLWHWILLGMAAGIVVGAILAQLPPAFDATLDGLRVTKAPEGAALKEGDVILKVGAVPVATADALAKALADSAGRDVELAVSRGGQEVKFKAKPDHAARRFALDFTDTVGAVFIGLIRVVMVPLVIASLVVGMASIGNPRKLGRIGLKALSYYLVTTALAVSFGLACVNAIKPGKWLPKEQAEKLKKDYAGSAESTKSSATNVQKSWTTWTFVKSIFPTNIVKAMTEEQMLPIIVFALLLGFCAMLLPPATSKPFLDATASFSDVMLKMVEVIMWLAPIGVFALMAKVILASGLSILGTLAGYALAVMLGLAIHFFAVYSLTVKLFSRLRIVDFWRGLRDVFITAFSTSSSAATLPVNMRSCRQRLNIPPTITSFVLPLGCTVNMDGTAVYQGVAAVFIAQVYGMDLTAGQQLSIILTATLASIGTAPVPGAGMVMLAVIMTPLGIPAEGLALIFGIDRFIDMFRTVLNVTGDAACTVMVASTEGEDVRYIPEEAPAPAS